MKIRFLSVLAILPFLLAAPIKAAPPTAITVAICRRRRLPCIPNI
jgi:hypothetical protein